MDTPDTTTKVTLAFTFRIPDPVESFRYEEVHGQISGANYTTALATYKKLSDMVATTFPRRQVQKTYTNKTNGTYSNGRGNYSNQPPFDFMGAQYTVRIGWDDTDPNNVNIRDGLKRLGFRYWGKKQGGDGSWKGNTFPNIPGLPDGAIMGGTPVASTGFTDSNGIEVDDIQF